MRETYDALMADTAQIDAILASGAERARVVAKGTISRLRKAVGRGLGSSAPHFFSSIPEIFRFF